MSRETYLLRMGGHRWADILQWMMGAEVSSYPRIILIALVSTEPTYSYHICLNRLPDIQPGPDQRVSLSAHAQYLDLHIFCLLIPWIQVCLSSVWSYPEGFCLFLPWIASANYVYFFFILILDLLGLLLLVSALSTYLEPGISLWVPGLTVSLLTATVCCLLWPSV